MPRDECINCDKHFPAGEGLTDGRCPACAAEFEEHQRAAKEAGASRPASKEEE